MDVDSQLSFLTKAVTASFKLKLKPADQKVVFIYFIVFSNVSLIFICFYSVVCETVWTVWICRKYTEWFWAPQLDELKGSVGVGGAVAGIKAPPPPFQPWTAGGNWAVSFLFWLKISDFLFNHTPSQLRELLTEQRNRCTSHAAVFVFNTSHSLEGGVKLHISMVSPDLVLEMKQWTELTWICRSWMFVSVCCVSGIDFKIRTIELDGKKIKLQIWWVRWFLSLMLQFLDQILSLTWSLYYLQ